MLQDSTEGLVVDPRDVAAVFAQHNAHIGNPDSFRAGAGFDDRHKRAEDSAVRTMQTDSHNAPAHHMLDAHIDRHEIFMALGKLKNGEACTPLDEVGN